MNSFFERKYVIQGIILIIAITIVARLFYLQIIDDSYLLSANNNVLRKVIEYPARGVILDRDGKILVQNEPVYDLMVTPREAKNIDTVLLCKLIGIDKEGFDKRMKKARDHSPYRASLFEKLIPKETFAILQEHMDKFHGFYTVDRNVRSYPDSVAAQFLGYIQEVNDNDIKRSNGFYRSGDYIGASGVERSYEELLRGTRGVKNQMVDALNRPQGSFMEGKYDTLAISGEGLVSSLDKELQLLAEKLMRNKLGSVVAIEPSTGEILTYVSSPSYNPNLMVGRERGNNYMKMLHDPYKPMFNRPIQASYPPGSIFKVIAALTAQQAGIISAETRFNCGGGYRYGRNAIMRCTGVHHSTDLITSIQKSCNTYYGYVYAHMLDRRGMPTDQAYDLWRDGLMQFGLGQPLGIDLPGEKGGNVFPAEYYTKHFGSNKWTSSYNISQSIGQGQLGITPLQMANLTAIVANRGFYYRPHLIKGIGEKQIVKKEFTEKIWAGVDAKHYEPVIEGMSRAVSSGSATASKIPGIEMCGKTGTVQNPHGENHAVFFAFAPRENPKIAIAVFVENAGYGGTWAAPIASMLIEKYIRDTISLPKYVQDRILNAVILPKTKKTEVKQKQDTTKKTNSNQQAGVQNRNTANVMIHHSQVRRNYAQR